MVNTIFNYLIFPGFLATLVLGMISSWIDRKVTARIHWRVGPPLLQPAYDVLKLLGKEPLVPEGANRLLFLSLPLFGLAAASLSATMIWRLNWNTGSGFTGDLIVLLYLLAVPSIAIILGGAASRNVYGALGSSREIKLVVSYELPFLLGLVIPVLHARSLLLGEIVKYQVANGSVIGSISGVIAFIVMVMCMQAKLGLVPFDMAEAETEIMAGPLTEYSGPPLAIFKMTRMIMLATMPLFAISVLWGGLNDLHAVWKYVVILVLFVLIRNTNPRVRIDQAMRFFWGPMTILAVLAVVLTIIGMRFNIPWL